MPGSAESGVSKGFLQKVHSFDTYFLITCCVLGPVLAEAGDTPGTKTVPTLCLPFYPWFSGPLLILPVLCFNIYLKSCLEAEF